MKTKIIILFMLLVSVGIAQQKKVTGKEKAGKELIELQKYPAQLTPIIPEYPKIAKLAGIQGKVYVEASIDEKGNVTETKIIKSDHETLNYMAMDAIKKTKFTPGISKENKKVKCKVVIPINFKLEEKDKALNLGVPIDAPGDISDPDINTFIKVEKMPEMLESAKPEYPEEAKANKITGKVYVKVLITKEGNPKKAVVIKSEAEILNQPAVDAAMKSKFSPALQGGKPIAVWIVLPFRFALDGVLESETPRVLQMKITSKEDNYPQKAIEQKIEGMVSIEVKWGEDGKVHNAKIIKASNSILDDNSLEVIKKITSTYGMKVNGKIVEGPSQIDIIYEINDK